MAAKTVKLNTVLVVILVFLGGEFLGYQASKLISVSPLLVTGVTRLIQIFVLVWLIVLLEERLSSIGWSPDTWRNGLYQGAVWSLGFALLAVTAMAVAYGNGYQPLRFFRADLSAYHLPTFFIVGGLVAPIFEELCFRGVIYTFMRQVGLKVSSLLFRNLDSAAGRRRLELWSAVAFAVVCSTAVFAILHFVRGIPVTQIVGGIVFAVAYEISGNLMVPITIHVTGNLAIFCLSLL